MFLKGPYLVLVIVLFKFCNSQSIVTNKQYALMPAIFHLDNYDNCFLFGDEALYCHITYNVQPLDPDNTTDIWRTIKTVSSKRTNYRHDWLRHGVCIQETCPNIKWSFVNDLKIKEGLKECYDNKYKHLGLKGFISELKCETQQSPYKINNMDILVGVLFCLYIVFVLFSSVYEGLARYQTKEKYDKLTSSGYGKIFASFSIFRNWFRLKTVNYDDPEVVSLCSIQGIRFFNMICVIMTHTVMINTAIGVENPLFIENLRKKYMGKLIANGGYVVQTYFLISAWLLTYNMYKVFYGKNLIKFKYLVMAFINRYIRLTPVLAVVVIFHGTWFVHLFRGPYWDIIVGDEYRRCRKNWWINILYLNNHIDANNMCLPQSWYMAVDTQYFIISLLIIWAMIKYPKKVYWILGGLTVIHIISMWLLIYITKLEVATRPYPENIYKAIVLTEKEWLLMMASPYVNLAGLIVGIFLGHIYYHYGTKEMSFFKNKFNLTLWWIGIWFGGLGIVLIPANILYADDFEYNVLFSAFHGCISRLIFAVAIGIGILGVTQKAGWMMNWVCSFRPFYVLGRLTYGAYLCHTILIRVRAGLSRSPVFLHQLLLAEELISDVVTAYMLALIIALLIELPISELQKMLIPSLKKSKETNENGDEIEKTKKLK